MAILVACLLGLWVFNTGAGGAQPDPVPFDQTKAFGLPSEDRLALEDRGLSVPRVQIFYSQYPYVVGYGGVERAVQTLEQPSHAQQFGVPLTIYVTEYGDTGVEVTVDGYLQTDQSPDWIAADRAWFVVGSDARTTVGKTVVPFETRRAARSFADAHGGELARWDALEDYSFDVDDVTTVRDGVTAHRRRADATRAALQPLVDREPTTVVGEDAPSVQAAVDRAPPNSTVVIPNGTYREHVTVDRPLTLRGENATLRGNGTGTVIEITHDDVAITGVQITGIGSRTRPPDAFENDRGEWDNRIDAAYGRGDAGIRVNASRVLVQNVAIETPTSGILVRDSTQVVVDTLALEGTAAPMDGFMGVLSIRSPVVVSNSTFDGGRDGIYLHRSHGSVLRNNTFYDNRFGIHFMYTSRSLIADNVARNQTSSGIVIMTSPARNAVVGNDVRDANDGIVTSGSRTYVAGNVVAFNGRGLHPGTEQSLYERNVVYGNEIGVRTGSILPSNTFRENDFVANERHAVAGIGPLRVWTDGDTGNYWQGAHGYASGSTLEGSYSPTNPTEGLGHRTGGAITLVESPAARALATIRDTSPGLRRGNIVDTAPRVDPVRPDVVAALHAATNTTDGQEQPTLSSDSGGESADD